MYSEYSEITWIKGLNILSLLVSMATIVVSSPPTEHVQSPQGPSPQGECLDSVNEVVMWKRGNLDSRREQNRRNDEMVRVN